LGALSTTCGPALGPGLSRQELPPESRPSLSMLASSTPCAIENRGKFVDELATQGSLHRKVSRVQEIE